MAGRRATQVAAARALGRVAAASPVCRSTVISLARDQQLLVRLLPALRCPLTIEEVEVSKAWFGTSRAMVLCFVFSF